MNSLNPYDAPETDSEAHQPRPETRYSPWTGVGAFLVTTLVFFFRQWLPVPRLIVDLLYVPGNAYPLIGVLMTAGGLSGALLLGVAASLIRRAISHGTQRHPGLTEAFRREFR